MQIDPITTKDIANKPPAARSLWDLLGRRFIFFLKGSP